MTAEDTRLAEARHQDTPWKNGWTGTIARTMHLFGCSTAEQCLDLGGRAAIVEGEPAKKDRSRSAARRRGR